MGGRTAMTRRKKPFARKVCGSQFAAFVSFIFTTIEISLGSAKSSGQAR